MLQSTIVLSLSLSLFVVILKQEQDQCHSTDISSDSNLKVLNMSPLFVS